MNRILPLTVLLFFSACNVPVPLQNAMDSMKNLLGMSQVAPAGSPSASPAATPNAAEATAKANGELLSEMLKVTFNLKEVEDQSQFLSLVSSLNQGASLEGIFRGLLMGSKYRVLESKAKAASPNAIKFFANEMVDLQLTMKHPTVFNKETAKQFPSIEFPEGASDTPDSYTFGETSTDTGEKKTKAQLTDELLQDFIGATPFTLKRVLADEVLKKMDEMKESPLDLPQWYATLVVRLADTNTDFGLPQRNSADFDFHFRFAKTMSVDRVKWEVLNRHLRIINRLE